MNILEGLLIVGAMVFIPVIVVSLAFFVDYAVGGCL